MRPLPEARGHATGHEDVLRQDLCIFPYAEIRARRIRPQATVPCDPPTTARTGVPMHRCRHDRGSRRRTAPPVPRARPRTGASTPLVLAVVAVLLRLPAFFADPVARASTTACSASSALAMRDGELPFRDIFSSQGPLFLPLLWVADLVGFRTHGRAAAALASPPACCSRSRSTRARAGSRRARNALLAAGLVTTSGSVLWVTGPVNADGPSLALSVLAVAFALRVPRRPAPAHRGVGGARGRRRGVDQGAVGAGGRDRRADRAAARTGRARACATRRWRRGSRWRCTWSPRCRGASSRVWDQSFAYHQDSRRRDTHCGRGAQDRRHARGTATSSCSLALRAGAAIAFVVRVRRRAGVPRDAGRPGARRSSSPGSCSGSCWCSALLVVGAGDVAGPRRPPRARRSPCSPRCGPPPWTVLAVARSWSRRRSSSSSNRVDPLARRLHRRTRPRWCSDSSGSRPTRW